MIKAFGYEKGSENLLALEEITIQCNIQELEDIIKFLKITKEEHEKAVDETEMCHSHFRDWCKKWTRKSSDIVIVTKR